MNIKKKSIAKKVISFILFFVILFFVLGITYKVLKWKDTTGNYMSSVDQLYNTDDNLIDVVFVGSSHVYCDIYPAIIWEKTGISAFNMSVSGQDKDSSYHHLVELLKTQSPKVVFVDLFGLTFDKHDVEGNLYRNLLSMKASKNSVSLVKDYFKGTDEKVNDYITRWPIIHTRYKELTKLDYFDFKPNTFMRGEELIFDVGTAYSSPSIDAPFNPGILSDRNYEWLNSLYELSLKEGFELVLFKTPFFSEPYNQSIIDAASVFAEENDLAFLDLNKHISEIGLEYSTDFYDSNHTNAYGAVKLSGFISDYLTRNYDLKDHRGDSKYWQWDSDLEYYYRAKFKKALYDSDSVTQLSNRMQDEDFKDFTAVISVEFTSAIEDEEHDYYKALKGLGMTYDDYLEGGKWIYKAGTLTKLIDNDIAKETVTYELNKYDTLSVKYTGDGKKGNVLIGANDYSNVFYYVSVTVYDDSNESVLVKKDF